MTTHYRKITNSLARSQRVHSNADMFEKRGDTWQPTERERGNEPRTVALRKRLLTPDEYSIAYGPLNPERGPVTLDKRKFNEEKRKRARFYKQQDGRTGTTRNNRTVSKSLARNKVIREAETIKEIGQKAEPIVKTSATWKDYGHFVFDGRPSGQSNREQKQERQARAIKDIAKWL